MNKLKFGVSVTKCDDNYKSFKIIHISKIFNTNVNEHMVRHKRIVN